MAQGLHRLAFESGARQAAPRHASLEARLFEGTVIAERYRIDTLIAEGGMGLVFRGRHLILDQPIALKIVRPSFAHNPIAVARFLDEARAIARLKSPHVAHVFDSGTVEDGPPYMALELLNGCDLRTLLEREGPLSCERAANYVSQACRAVSEAHSLGIVHRDLKPENLFLHRSSDGPPIIKVLDFGISKRLNPDDGRSYTIEGETLGSPHYMAPEQMSAAHLDERVDIWALGVVLFELVTGRVPFRGDNIAQVCSALLSEEAPPISSVRSEVPAAFEEIVGHCLRKNPTERYWHVDELAEALRGFLSGTASPAPLPASHANVPVDSDTPTLISVAPPASVARRSPSSLRSVEVHRRARARSGFLFPSLAGVLAACITIATLVGLKSWMPSQLPDSIPLSAAALLSTLEEPGGGSPGPSPSELDALERAVVETPTAGPFVTPVSADRSPPRRMLEQAATTSKVLPVARKTIEVVPVPVSTPMQPEFDAAEPSSSNASASEPSVIGQRIRSLAAAAPRVPPPRVPGRRPLPSMDPSEPIVPVKRPDTSTPPAELDELIPPYESPATGSGAEQHDAASKRYF